MFSVNSETRWSAKDEGGTDNLKRRVTVESCHLGQKENEWTAGQKANLAAYRPCFEYKCQGDALTRWCAFQQLPCRQFSCMCIQQAERHESGLEFCQVSMIKQERNYHDQPRSLR